MYLCICLFVCLLFVFIWFSRLTQRLRVYGLFFGKIVKAPDINQSKSITELLIETVQPVLEKKCENISWSFKTCAPAGSYTITDLEWDTDHVSDVYYEKFQKSIMKIFKPEINFIKSFFFFQILPSIVMVVFCQHNEQANGVG